MLLFSNQERAGMAISIFDNKDLIPKCVIGDKEWFYILIKVSIHQSDIIFINVYTTNNRIPTYMKQTLTELKKEIESYKICVYSTVGVCILVEDFTHQWDEVKINKRRKKIRNIWKLNNTLSNNSRLENKKKTLEE